MLNLAAILKTKMVAISNFTKKLKHPVFDIRYIKVSKNATKTNSDFPRKLSLHSLLHVRQRQTIYLPKTAPTHEQLPAKKTII